MSKVDILNGNELLIQGALEAGFNLYTGYPGSPLADFFNILHEERDELHKKGIRVAIANSEANAAAMASGGKMAGQNVLVAMKSMGLHVASDALSVGNFANPGTDKNGERAGVVVVVGDDPWSISTSTPADSRYLFKHLHMPFLEPSTPQELKDWMIKALELSKKSSVYTGLLLTTFMAEGGGRVEVGEAQNLSHDLIELDPATFNLSANVMVPPNSLIADKEMITNRFPKMKAVLESLNLDQEFGNNSSKIGVISGGAVFETLKQVLEESDLIHHFRLYKAASSYPMNEKQLLPFLKGVEKLIVVEEKRGFLETEVKDVMLKANLSYPVYGKEFQTGDQFVAGFPAFGGLTYEIIYKKLQELLDIFDWQKSNEVCLKDLPAPIKLDVLIPRRLPTFCPGCPHRETLSVMKEVRSVLAKDNIKLISHGDVGCYSLSFLEPFKEMHDLSAMGQGGSLAAGADIFTSNPSVVLMGDSTFFHSGLTSISNSVQLGHNITYILLDNDNTAMTGHQMSPGSGISVEGNQRPRQKMLEVAKSLQVTEAIEVNPSDRFFYKNLLLDFVKKPGTKVIVSNKECGLTFHGRKKREERKLFSKGGVEAVRGFYQINTLACEDCRACVDMTGCPGLSQTFDAYGTKVMIDPQICVSDSYCTKIKACPSFELVNVSDYHPTKYKKEAKKLESKNLPEPVVVKTMNQVASGDDFRALVIGVGGSGVTTISRVLAEASREMEGREDLSFKFVDQKGLAQRNGSVSSHVVVYSNKKSHGQVIPTSSSDLVLSPDLLEGARALDYLGPQGVLVVDQDFQIPLSILLDRGVDGNPMTRESLQAELKAKLGDRLLMAPMKEMCFEQFEKSVYASAMLLGIVFQAGRMPFSLNSLKGAFQRAVPKAEFENNWQAFQMGREWYLGQIAPISASQNLSELWRLSAGLVAYPWQSVSRFEALFENYRNQLHRYFPEVDEDYLSQYIHDVMVFDQGKSVPAFIEDAIKLKDLYAGDDLIRALRMLAKTYWIKDEVFVSHQMISPVKLAKDKDRYGSLGTSFKVVHINRPAFDIFGRKIEFDFSPKIWMLKTMRHFRILRTLMPEWHKEERRLSQVIRGELLAKASEKRLRELEQVKGYREVRYALARQFKVG